MSDSYETGEDDVYTADPSTLPTEMGGPWFNTTNISTENNITVEEDNHIEEYVEALELESSLLKPIKVEAYLEPVDTVDASNIKVINGEETYAAEAAEDQEKSDKPAPSSSRSVSPALSSASSKSSLISNSQAIDQIVPVIGLLIYLSLRFIGSVFSLFNKWTMFRRMKKTSIIHSMYYTMTSSTFSGIDIIDKP